MLKKALIIPPYNEVATIQKVVNKFHKALPDTNIVIIENNSTDNTNKLAKQILKKNKSEKRFTE